MAADAATNATVFDSIAIKDKIYLNSHETDAPRIEVQALTANAANNVTISNVAPGAVGTATISAWLPIAVAGVTYYIPCWT